MEDVQVGNRTGSIDDLQSASEQRWTGIHSLTRSASIQEFPSLFFKPQDAAARTVKLAGQSIRQQVESEIALLHSDIEGKNRIIGDLRQEHDELKTGYDGLQLNYDTLQSGYNDLLLKFKQQKEEKEEAENNYNEAFDALENAAAEVDTLTQQIADKDKQIEDLKNLSEETLSAKQEEIDGLEENIRSLRNQRGSDRSTIQNLEQQLAQAREYHQYLSNQLTGVLFLEEDLTDDIIRLEEEKHALEAQLDAANEENERLSHELAVTRQQLEQTEADLQRTSEQLQQLYNSFNNIETADKQEAIAYLKGLSKLIQDGQFPADGVNIRSTSGLWRGGLSSLADIQGEINDLELEFAKAQGPDYCVNQIINELVQPEIVDPEGSLDRINMLARAYFSVPDQRPIGEAIVKAAVQRSIPDDSTYQALCESFGREEAQKMAVSVLNDQSIAELCQEANVCSEQGAPAEAAAKLRDILMRNIPEAISQCCATADFQKRKQLAVEWGLQALEFLKNGQYDKFREKCDGISKANGVGIGLSFFINLEADEIEKQIKEFREKCRIKQPDGSVFQAEEAFFNELGNAVQAMRNLNADCTSCEQARVGLFKCFDPVLQILAQHAYTVGETVFLRDARTLFDSILARSESFAEKANFLEVMGNGDECQGAFNFASNILPNIDKFQVNGNEFVSATGERDLVSNVLCDHFKMFDCLQKTVGHYALQVHNNLLPQYQGNFREFLSNYVLKNSRPESIAGLMRLPVICGSYNYALGAPAEFLGTVSSIENAAESLRKAYLLSFIINNDGSEVDGYGAPIVEVYNKIIEIADAAESPAQYEPLLQRTANEGVDFGPISLEDAKNMCLKYAMSRDFIEAYQNLDGNYTGAVNFISDKYGVSFPFYYPHRNLIGLGLNPNLIGAFAGSSVSEQASQKAEQWKQGQLAQDGVSYEAYQAALAIKEAVNVTNANFWHQVGDSLIDIGREFCQVLKDGEAPEEDIGSIRNHFYALIRECETNGGGVGIIPQTLPF